MILRATLCLALGSLIVAPAPGSTGGCAAADDPAEFVLACTRTRAWECQRQLVRGELADDAAVQECVDEQYGRCLDIDDWPIDCQPFPTIRDVDNCVEQLQRADQVDVPFSEIPECDFCP